MSCLIICSRNTSTNLLLVQRKAGEAGETGEQQTQEEKEEEDETREGRTRKPLPKGGRRAMIKRHNNLATTKLNHDLDYKGKQNKCIYKYVQPRMHVEPTGVFKE